MHIEDKNRRKLHTVGVLLVHDVNSSLGDMDELTSFLASYDIVTLNVLFPDHGALARDRLTADGSWWSSAVSKGLRKLKQLCTYVFLIGHSLGGALCLHIAASEPVAGIVTMSVPVYLYPWMLPAVHRVTRFTTVPPRLYEDLCGYEARRRYTGQMHGRTPLASAEDTLHYLPLLRTELPAITAPVLIMTAIHDHVVPARDAQAIYRLIGSQEKYLVKFRRSSHLLVKGHDREEVFARTLDFIQCHACKMDRT